MERFGDVGFPARLESFGFLLSCLLCDLYCECCLGCWMENFGSLSCMGMRSFGPFRRDFISVLGIIHMVGFVYLKVLEEWMLECRDPLHRRLFFSQGLHENCSESSWSARWLRHIDQRQAIGGGNRGRKHGCSCSL